MSNYLETANDLLLVDNIKNDKEVNDSLKVLTERHTGLFVKTLSNYYDVLGSNNYYSFLGNKESIFFSAAKTFNEEKGTIFPTYLANTVKWTCLNSLNIKKKKISECLLPQEDLERLIVFDSKDIYKDESFDKEFFFNLIEKEISLINDDRAREIFRLRYFSLEKKNVSWKIIGEKLGLSVQGCIDIHNRYAKCILKNIKKVLRS